MGRHATDSARADICISCTAPDCDPRLCPLLGHSPEPQKPVIDDRSWSNYERIPPITVNGETHTLREWSEITGISYMTIYMRIMRGWQPEDAVVKQLHPYRGRKREDLIPHEHSEQHCAENP